MKIRMLLEEFGAALTAVLVVCFLAFLAALLTGCSGEPTAKQCMAAAQPQAAVNLCLQVKGCTVTAGDIRMAMEAGVEKSRLGCPE